LLILPKSLLRNAILAKSEIHGPNFEHGTLKTY
jgi:hypothetical protein